MIKLRFCGLARVLVFIMFLRELLIHSNLKTTGFIEKLIYDLFIRFGAT